MEENDAGQYERESEGESALDMVFEKRLTRR